MTTGQHRFMELIYVSWENVCFVFLAVRCVKLTRLSQLRALHKIRYDLLQVGLKVWVFLCGVTLLYCWRLLVSLDGVC